MVVMYSVPLQPGENCYSRLLAILLLYLPSFSCLYLGCWEQPCVQCFCNRCLLSVGLSATLNGVFYALGGPTHHDCEPLSILLSKSLKPELIIWDVKSIKANLGCLIFTLWQFNIAIQNGHL